MSNHRSMSDDVLVPGDSSSRDPGYSAISPPRGHLAGVNGADDKTCPEGIATYLPLERGYHMHVQQDFVSQRTLFSCSCTVVFEFRLHVSTSRKSFSIRALERPGLPSQSDLRTKSALEYISNPS